MIILLAVLALVVVNALAESPWGVFTVGATIPIAMFMGGYLRFMRVGKVLEISGDRRRAAAARGLGRAVRPRRIRAWRTSFTLNAEPLAWAIIVYGFAASVLPVWLLLAPRDYLSTFMKLGTIFALALGVLLVLPRSAHAGAHEVRRWLRPRRSRHDSSRFVSSPSRAARSRGFHSLISSGITPKIITRESYARPSATAPCAWNRSSPSWP